VKLFTSTAAARFEDAAAAGRAYLRARVMANGSDEISATVADITSTEPIGSTRKGAAGYLPVGTMFHRYVLLKPVGEGAMGVVYAAYDQGLDRKVALKLLREPHAGGSHRRRLLREAQALAKLSHPNVVSVYDMGSYREQTFIAMELVDGRTLRHWLNEAPRSVREVLEVYRAAGAGLAAAHAAGLVHRDFKPDNVLIDRAGRVRVGDFGLALLARDGDHDTDDDEGDVPPKGPPSNAPLTRTGAVMGTPAYMAPEQWRGERVDARADQFSFAVALYQGLCEVHPFAGGAGEPLLESIVRGRLRASARGVPAWLLRAIGPALAADPARRYPSMAAFLERLVDRRAARARFAAAGALALALVATTAALAAKRSGPLEQPCRGAEGKLRGVWDGERKQAVEAAFRASGAPASAAGRAWSFVEGELDRRAAQWIALHTEACEATRVRGEQSGELLDRRMHCLERRRLEMRALGNLFVQAGPSTVDRAADAIRALPALEACSVEAVRHEVLPPAPTLRPWVEELERRNADVYARRAMGEFAEALPEARAVAREAAELGYRPLQAVALLELAKSQASLADYAGAVDTLYDAIAAAESSGSNQVATEAWVELVWQVGEGLSRYPDALQLARVARGSLERLGGNELIEARLEDYVGTIYLTLEQLDRARPLLERALALREKAYGPGPSPDVAASLQHLGLLFQAEHKDALALPLHRRAREMVEQIKGPDNEHTLQLLNGETYVYLTLGEHGRVLELAGLGLERLAASGAAESENAASFLGMLGESQRKTGRLDEARRALERALALAEKLLGPDHVNTAVSAADLGDALLDAGHAAEAVRLYERAVKTYERKLGPTHSRVASGLYGLGRALVAAGRAKAAVAPLERALVIFEGANAPPDDLAATRRALAEALRAAGGDAARAKALDERARLDEQASGGADAGAPGRGGRDP
jgi:eukaryotic-like serine/threonine-protein kinase